MRKRFPAVMKNKVSIGANIWHVACIFALRDRTGFDLSEIWSLAAQAV